MTTRRLGLSRANEFCCIDTTTTTNVDVAALATHNIHQVVFSSTRQLVDSSNPIMDDKRHVDMLDEVVFLFTSDAHSIFVCGNFSSRRIWKADHGESLIVVVVLWPVDDGATVVVDGANQWSSIGCGRRGD